jgi:hypothetical protein
MDNPLPSQSKSTSLREILGLEKRTSETLSLPRIGEHIQKIHGFLDGLDTMGRSQNMNTLAATYMHYNPREIGLIRKHLIFLGEELYRAYSRAVAQGAMDEKRALSLLRPHLFQILTACAFVRFSPETWNARVQTYFHTRQSYE